MRELESPFLFSNGRSNPDYRRVLQNGTSFSIEDFKRVISYNTSPYFLFISIPIISSYPTHKNLGPFLICLCVSVSPNPM